MTPNSSRIQKLDGNGRFLAAWGTYGSGNGQLAGPTGVAVDATGNVFVADQSNDRMQKLACQ
jgi:DNA-binding beta-propeller fold protein YncE